MSEKCHSLLVNKRGRLLGQVATVAAEFGNRQVLPEHYHPEDQLIFASHGVMTLRTSPGIWVVPPLRAVWIPAKIPHSVEMSGCVSMRTLYFLPGLMRFPRAKCSVIHVSSLLRELILHACEFPRLNKSVRSQKALIEMLVAQVASASSIPLQLSHPVDARAARVVTALLTDPADNRTLEKLCRQCGASKRTVQRIFLSEAKMSFARWRQQLRLLRAMQSIASGEKVSSAALDAGYSSPSAFTSMFRKQLGTTPMAYFRS